MQSCEMSNVNDQSPYYIVAEQHTNATILLLPVIVGITYAGG